MRQAQGAAHRPAQRLPAERDRRTRRRRPRPWRRRLRPPGRSRRRCPDPARRTAIDDERCACVDRRRGPCGIAGRSAIATMGLDDRTGLSACITAAEAVVTGTSSRRNRSASARPSCARVPASRSPGRHRSRRPPIRIPARAPPTRCAPSSRSSIRRGRPAPTARKRATMGFWRLVIAGTQEE